MFSWQFTSLPDGSTATLFEPNAVNPSFVIDLLGIYIVELIVNDGHSDSLSGTVLISTESTPPVADAGPAQSGVVGQQIVLNGSASSDVDGQPLTFAWEIVSAPFGSSTQLDDPTSVSPAFGIDVAGTYVITLAVSDGLSEDQDTAIVTTVNSAPVADAGPDQSTMLGSTVLLRGGSSSDVDGDALSFVWSFSSRPPNSTATLVSPNSSGPSFVIDVFGEYVIQLTVSDLQGEEGTDTVRVSTVNVAPVADAGIDQSAAVAATITLDGGGSSDADGDAITYFWSISSAPPGSSAALDDPTTVTPQFTLDLPGDYVIQLLVNDAAEDSAPDTVIVSTTNTAPVAEPGQDLQGSVDEVITLDGSTSFDAEDDPLIFTWSIVSQPEGSAINLSNPAAFTPTFTADISGTYIFQLVVDDGFLSSSPATVEVTLVGLGEGEGEGEGPPPICGALWKDGAPINKIGDALILLLVGTVLIALKSRWLGVRIRK
jgi:hypothetical protein